LQGYTILLIFCSVIVKLISLKPTTQMKM